MGAGAWSRPLPFAYEPCSLNPGFCSEAGHLPAHQYFMSSGMLEVPERYHGARCACKEHGLRLDAGARIMCEHKG